MFQAAFEPLISISKWPQTHALNCVTTSSVTVFALRKKVQYFITGCLTLSKQLCDITSQQRPEVGQHRPPGTQCYINKINFKTLDVKTQQR